MFIKNYSKLYLENWKNFINFLAFKSRTIYLIYKKNQEILVGLKIWNFWINKK